MRSGILAACAAAALSGGAASAQDNSQVSVQSQLDAAVPPQFDRHDRGYAAVWIVQESEQPLGPRTVRRGDIVLRNRLLPPRLMRLTSAAVNARNGDIVLPAGTQLFGAVTSGAPVYCTVQSREPSAGERFLIGRGGARRLCVADLDGDGDADQHFRAPNQIAGVPNFSARRPEAEVTLRGGTFENIPPEQIEVPFEVNLRYVSNGGVLARQVPTFQIQFGVPGRFEQLSAPVLPRQDKQPLLVTALQSAFTITAVRDGAIAIDVSRNIPRQPFTVTMTTTTTFY